MIVEKNGRHAERSEASRVVHYSMRKQGSEPDASLRSA
jgi:hypothetical protein